MRRAMRTHAWGVPCEVYFKMLDGRLNVWQQAHTLCAEHAGLMGFCSCARDTGFECA